MESFSPNITKRVRRRRTRTGQAVTHIRYVLNYRDPRTGRRTQEFFGRQADAAARRVDLITQVANGNYFNRRTAPTVGAALDHWLEDRKGKVKAATLEGYKFIVAHVRGPLIIAPALERVEITSGRASAAGKRVVVLLGDRKISDLTTGEIRAWHTLISQEVGIYTANRAKTLLKAALALAEEDFGIRGPSMPSGLSRARQKPKKAILSAPEVAKVIEAARNDPAMGVYYSFPFLVGTRPSEQLGLLWEDVDFEANLIRIRRVQERDGSLTEMTKTVAGTREVPMAPVLREMLLAWRVACPRNNGQLYLVFPGPGRVYMRSKPRIGGGGPMSYQNFRTRHWRPIFEKLGLPYVTPHSARHSFISILQAQGVEVGLVAKLAGHANAMVTLGHYTQAVRGGEDAIVKLQQAYQGVA